MYKYCVFADGNREEECHELATLPAADEQCPYITYYLIL